MWEERKQPGNEASTNLTCCLVLWLCTTGLYYVVLVVFFFLLVLMHHMQVYISGKQYHSDLKSVFAASTSDSPDSCTLVRVEGFAMYHYSNVEGWPCALHAEASSFTAMFILLMWDVIFTSGIPDVFRTPFQVECLLIQSVQDSRTDRWKMQDNPAKQDLWQVVL